MVGCTTLGRGSPEWSAGDLAAGHQDAPPPHLSIACCGSGFSFLLSVASSAGAVGHQRAGLFCPGAHHAAKTEEGTRQAAAAATDRKQQSSVRDMSRSLDDHIVYVLLAIR